MKKGLAVLALTALLGSAALAPSSAEAWWGGGYGGWGGPYGGGYWGGPY
ncbi:MAG: sulfur globule protein, partial [Magnetococcales bacterium]|nr:sulfur globule protein [Magnetococcales bacterium]